MVQKNIPNMWKIRILVLGLAIFALQPLSADTILFRLYGNPDQYYAFTRTDTEGVNSESPDWLVTVPAGPYPAALATDTTDQAFIFCVNFGFADDVGRSDSGTLRTPPIPVAVNDTAAENGTKKIPVQPVDDRSGG